MTGSVRRRLRGLSIFDNDPAHKYTEDVLTVSSPGVHLPALVVRGESGWVKVRNEAGASSPNRPYFPLA